MQARWEDRRVGGGVGDGKGDLWLLAAMEVVEVQRGL